MVPSLPAWQPCLHQLSLQTVNKQAASRSDRPGNLSLERVAKSRKVMPGLAAEVSGHVTESAESAVPAL